MTLTFEEICERLGSQIDETDLIDYLETNSQELVERYKDKIEDRIEFFAGLVEDDDDDSRGS